MNPRLKVVAVVCIAVFAFTAIAAAPLFALIDAETPIDALFWTPASAPVPPLDSIALPAAPSLDARPSRAPPLA